MIVREFRREDLDRCLDLNRIQFAESGQFTHINLDMEKLKNSYLNSINNPKLKVFVMEDDDKIVGACAVSLVQYLWNYDTFVYDHFYYIHPDHRGGLNAFKLFKRVEEFAKRCRALEIHFNYAHSHEFNKMNVFLSRLGYTKFNEGYRKMVI